MSETRLISRAHLINVLRELGFDGPFTAGRHQFMVNGNLTLRIPDLSRTQVTFKSVLRQVRQVKVGEAELAELLKTMESRMR